MKFKPFDDNKTPKDCLLLVYFSDWGYRLAAYKKILPTSDSPVWRLQGTGIHGETNGDWHDTENTFWCELPTVPTADCKGRDAKLKI